MRRTTIAELDEAQLAQAMAESELADRWSGLRKLAGEDASRILQLVCRIEPSNRIAELRDRERVQAEQGAGFLGMLPDQIARDPPAPIDLATSVAVAVELAKIRAANLEALVNVMPQYRLAFTGSRFNPRRGAKVPSSWSLHVDITGIRAALDLFDAKNATPDAALTVAEMPAFAQMTRHRRELGYVPEPLIDANGLAWCLEHAASHDPIDEIWRWLHPQNFFDLSDLHTHRAEYRDLIDRLVKDGGLADHILGAIAPYAPPGVAFDDRLTFAVGWGIRGWATNETGGMNIEHAKDNFADMLPTLVHETFHRLQTVVARPHPELQGRGFDRITSYPFEVVEDRWLYRALCYVMLEGSATYVADPNGTVTRHGSAKGTIDILARIEALIPADTGEDASDGLLNEGLRSNGPFYGFGALLSHAMVEEDGPASLGMALQAGAPFFLKRGLALLGSGAPAVPDELVARMNRLHAVLSA